MGLKLSKEKFTTGAGTLGLGALLVLGLMVILWISCGKKTLGLEAVPPEIAFEVQRTQDPRSGELPSHLKYLTLDALRIQTGKAKKERVYPNSWYSVDDRFASLAITQIVHDPSDPMVFYFSTGEGFFNADAARGAGIWKSEDGGESWSQLGSTSGSEFYYCQDLVVHPQSRDIYVSTRTAGVMRSQDGGDSWESVLGAQFGSPTDRAVDLEIAGDGAILASLGHFSTGGIYYSATGDPNSWELRMNGIVGATYRIELTASPSDPAVYYAACEGTNRRVQGIYRSDDRGLNWQRLADPGGNDSLANEQAWYDLIIKVDPTDPDVVVAGGLNLWRSRDGGQSWQQLCEGDRRKKSSLQYVHVDQHEVVFQSPDTVYFTNDGGIYRSTDFGSDTPHIYQINQNYNVTQYYSVDQGSPTGSHLVVGGTQDNGSSRSTSAGISDFEQVSWADGSFCAVDHQDERFMYTTTQYQRVFRWDGTRLDTLTNPSMAKLNTLFINPLIMDATDPQILYQASSQGVWRLSAARTATENDWVQATRQVGGITALASSASRPYLLFLGRSLDGIPYRVEDAHLSDANTIPQRMDRDGQLPDQAYLNCIFVDPANEQHVLLAYSNYNTKSVYETHNALDYDPNWVNVEGDLPNLPVRWIALHPEDPTVCYLATEMGVYYTDSLEGGQTRWKRTDPGLPNVRVDMIKVRKSDGKLVAATHGRGIFEGTLDGNNVLWTERGPSNVGGRTRTLMIDPNARGNRSLWAGSVSGGLWRIQNVDSVDVFYENTDLMNSGIFPNPASRRVYIQPAGQGSYDLELYSISGSLIGRMTCESMTELDVSGLANGTYLLVIRSGTEREVHRLLVQH